MQQKARWGHVGSGFGMELETKGLVAETRAGSSAWMPGAWCTCVDASAVTVNADQSGRRSRSVSHSVAVGESLSRLRGAIAWASGFFAS